MLPTDTGNKKQQRDIDPNAIYSLINSFNNLTNAFKQFNLPNITKHLYLQPQKPGYGNKGGNKYHKPPTPKPAIKLDGFLKAFSNGLKAFKFNKPFMSNSKKGFLNPPSQRVLVKRTFLSNQVIVLKPPGYVDKQETSEKVSEENNTNDDAN